MEATTPTTSDGPDASHKIRAPSDLQTSSLPPMRIRAIAAKNLPPRASPATPESAPVEPVFPGSPAPSARPSLPLSSERQMYVLPCRHCTETSVLVSPNQASDFRSVFCLGRWPPVIADGFIALANVTTPAIRGPNAIRTAPAFDASFPQSLELSVCNCFRCRTYEPPLPAMRPSPLLIEVPSLGDGSLGLAIRSAALPRAKVCDLRVIAS